MAIRNNTVAVNDGGSSSNKNKATLLAARTTTPSVTKTQTTSPATKVATRTVSVTPPKVQVNTQSPTSQQTAPNRVNVVTPSVAVQTPQQQAQSIINNRRQTLEDAKRESIKQDFAKRNALWSENAEKEWNKSREEARVALRAQDVQNAYGYSDKDNDAAVKNAVTKYQDINQRRDVLGLEHESPNVKTQVSSNDPTKGAFSYYKDSAIAAGKKAASGAVKLAQSVPRALEVAEARRKTREGKGRYHFDYEDAADEVAAINAKAKEESADWGIKKYDEDAARRLSQYNVKKGSAAETVGEISSNIGNMAPSILANLVLPGSGMAVLFMSAAGNKMEEVMSQGYDFDKAVSAGVLSGITEVATEQLFGGIPAFGKGSLDAAIDGAIDDMASDAVSRALLKYVINSAGEGTEELLSEYADAYAQLLWRDDITAGDINFNDVTEDACRAWLLGAVVGAVMDAGSFIPSGIYAQDVEAFADFLVDQNILEESAVRNRNGSVKNEILNLYDTGIGNTNFAKAGKAMQEGTAAPAMQDIFSGIKQNAESNKARLSQMAEMNNAVVDSLQGEDKRRAERVLNVAKTLHTNVVLDPTVSENGYFDPMTGDIHINPYSPNGVKTVFVHEMTHRMEGTKYYNRLKDFVEEDFDDAAARNNIPETLDSYKARLGRSYSPDEIDSEVVANYTQQYLFDDPVAIEKFAAVSKSEARRIWEGLKSIVKGEDPAIRQAEYLYSRALGEANERADAGYYDNIALQTNPLYSRGINRLRSEQNGNILSPDGRGQEVGGVLQEDGGAYLEGEGNDSINEGIREALPQDESNVETNLRRINDVLANNKEAPKLPLRSVDAETFAKELEKQISKENPYHNHLSYHDSNYYYDTGMLTFLDKTGKAGFAVRPSDGYISSVFNKSGVKGGAENLLITAISFGGKYLDCTGVELLSKYSQFGFVPVAKLHFDGSYYDDWDYARFGEPDVFFMAHVGDSAEETLKKAGKYPVPNPDAVPYFDDPDEAEAYAQSVAYGEQPMPQYSLSGTGLDNSENAAYAENQPNWARRYIDTLKGSLNGEEENTQGNEQRRTGGISEQSDNQSRQGSRWALDGPQAYRIARGHTDAIVSPQKAGWAQYYEHLKNTNPAYLNADGTPLVTYRGSGALYDRYNMQLPKSGDYDWGAVFVTESPEVALSYAEGKAGLGGDLYMYPVSINSQYEPIEIDCTWLDNSLDAQNIIINTVNGLREYLYFMDADSDVFLEALESARMNMEAEGIGHVDDIFNIISNVLRSNGNANVIKLNNVTWDQFSAGRPNTQYLILDEEAIVPATEAFWEDPESIDRYYSYDADKVADDFYRSIMGEYEPEEDDIDYSMFDTDTGYEYSKSGTGIGDEQDVTDEMSTAAFAPTFYSKLQREVANFKGDKIGAASVINYMKGKGVKDEEIKWSGINTFLDGKKSVGKQELLDYLAANSPVITRERLGMISDSVGQDIMSYHNGNVLLNTLDLVRDWGYVDEKTLRRQLRRQAKDYAASLDLYPYNITVEEADPLSLETFDNAYNWANDYNYKYYALIPTFDILDDYAETHPEIYEQLNSKGKYYNKDGDECYILDLYLAPKSGADSEYAGLPKWNDSSYKIPGGNDYREYKYKYPARKYQNDAMKTHWDDRGVISHARVQDFTTPDNQRVLFIDEIQSDWANEANSRGVRKPGEDASEYLAKQYDKLTEELTKKPALKHIVDKLMDKRGWAEYYAVDYMMSHNALVTYDNLLLSIIRSDSDEYPGILYTYSSWATKLKQYTNDMEKLNAGFEDSEIGVPDLPFADNYTDFVLKSLIREAAENDYDYLAWTTGKMQEDRWSAAYSEGYRIEYDQDIPKFLNKYGKQWGARVNSIEMTDKPEPEGPSGVDWNYWQSQGFDQITDDNRYEYADALYGIYEDIERAFNKLISSDALLSKAVDYANAHYTSRLSRTTAQELIETTLRTLKYPHYSNANGSNISLLHAHWSRELRGLYEYCNLTPILRERGMTTPIIAMRAMYMYDDLMSANAVDTTSFYNDIGGIKLGPHSFVTENDLMSMQPAVRGEDIEYRYNVPAIPITPQMKQSVLYEGQPMYSKPGTGIGEGNGREKVSKVASNTYTNADFIADVRDATMHLNDVPNPYSYQVEGEMESMYNAVNRVNSDINAEMQSLPTKDYFDGEDTDTAMLIMRQLFNVGNIPEALRWAKIIQEKGTEAGQRIQAFAKYTRTPEGFIVKGERVINNYLDEWIANHPREVERIKQVADHLTNWFPSFTADITTEEGFQAVAEYIRSLAKANGLKVDETEIPWIVEQLAHRRSAEEVERAFERLQAGLGTDLTGEEIDEIYEYLEEAKQYPATSKEAAELQAKAAAVVAKHLNSTAEDKWNAWRYLAMLGNTRTHLRNFLGNTLFGTVVGVKNALAGTLEATTGLFTDIDRTKTANLAYRATAEGRALFNAALQDANDIYTILDGQSKYNIMNDIEGQKQIFDFVPLEAFRKFNGEALEAEDWLALKRDYARFLSNYMYANGLDPSILADPRNAQANKARAYAVEEAQKATFRNYNAFASKLSEFSKGLSSSDNLAARGIGTMVEGLVPFKNTPANVLARGIEYSPIGLANAIGKGVNMVAKGTVSADEFIDSLSSGLTGTGIMALGYMLASMGLVTGGEDDDEKLQALKDAEGWQAYSLHIGDKYYSIDWMAPAAIPLFVGANLEQLGEVNGIDFNDFVTAITQTAEPITEMTMLQGVNNLLDSIKYGENGITDVALTTATNYLTQGVPTALGQVARAVDETRRTSSSSNTGTLGDLEYTWRKVKNKIPGLSKQNEPYLDIWGNEQQNTGGSFAGRLAFNMLSPGYYSEDSTSRVDEFVEELYEATGEAKYLPSKAGHSLKIDGEKRRLTAEEYTLLAKTKGNVAYGLIDEFLGSGGKKTVEECADAVEVAYQIANAYAKAKVGGDLSAKEEWYLDCIAEGVNPLDLMSMGDLTSDRYVSITSKQRDMFLDELKAGHTMETVQYVMDFGKKQRPIIYELLDKGVSKSQIETMDRDGNGSWTQTEIYESALSEEDKRLIWEMMGYKTSYDKYARSH